MAAVQRYSSHDGLALEAWLVPEAREDLAVSLPSPACVLRSVVLQAGESVPTFTLTSGVRCTYVNDEDIALVPLDARVQRMLPAVVGL